MIRRSFTLSAVAITLATLPGIVQAQSPAAGTSASANRPSGADVCRGLPGHAALKAALDTATQAETSGLNNQMWATIVNRDGIVCAVAFSGADRGDAVARQPRHLRAEGQHGERLQPGRGVVRRRLGPGVGPGALDGEPVLRRAAGRQPVRAAARSNPVDTDGRVQGPRSAQYGHRERPAGRPPGGRRQRLRRRAGALQPDQRAT